MTLSLPDRVYNLGLVVVFAVVVGVVLLIGSRYIDGPKPVPVDESRLAAERRISEAWRIQCLQLIDIIRQIDPDNPVLTNYKPFRDPPADR